MITPKEIQQQCLKWWKSVLRSWVDNVPFFPKEINKIGKVTSKDILNKLSNYKQSIELLRNNAKENKKYGYRLILNERQFDKIGKQPVPEKIIIESLEDYLKITGKEKEFQIFQKNYSLIYQTLPILVNWIKLYPLKLIEHDTWQDTLKVCNYFLTNPKPNLYIRQLPIDIHTKYILQNQSVVQSLLEFLIPEQMDTAESRFERRFHLKYAEPLLRIRFLDAQLSPIPNITDLSLTLSEFKNFSVVCENIFVTENSMNFLTLPPLPKTITIWSGGGFQVSYLKDIAWLKAKQFFYWGDLDAQGFQILNQFRSYFPNTIAVMMEEETLTNFTPTTGETAAIQNLQQLSASEWKLYNYLQQENIRLEQEKITQAFAEEKINRIFQNV